MEPPQQSSDMISLAYPFSLLIFSLMSSLGSAYPWVCLVSISCLLLLSAARIFLLSDSAQNTQTPTCHMPLLLVCQNLVFSLTVSAAVYHYGLAIESAILTLFIVVAACMETDAIANSFRAHLLGLISLMLPFLMMNWMISILEPSLDSTTVLLGFGMYGSLLLYLGRDVRRRNNNVLRQYQSQLQTLETDFDGVAQSQSDAQHSVEGKFFAFMERSPDPVAVMKDWKIVYANQAALTFFGHEVGSLMNLGVDKLIHKDSLQLVADLRHVDWSTDAPLVELCFCKSDGSLVYGEARWTSTVFNDVAATLVIIRDLTIRRKAIDAIRRSEKEFKYLAEWIPDPIIVSVRGRFAYANQAAQKASGYTHQELKAMPVYDLLHSDDQATLSKRRHEIASGLAPDSEEVRVTRKDGKTLIMELHSFKGAFADDENATIVHLHDLTAKRAAEANLRYEEAQTRQAQKMEAIGTLAGGIAHDFNNSLSSVIGYSELVKSTLDKNSDAFSYINLVLLASRGATDLIKQILTFSRRNQENKINLELEAFVRSALLLLKPSLSSSIELISHFNAPVSTVFADETQVQQIIINLYTNAADAIGSLPGVIELTLDEVTSSSNPVLSKGDYLRLTVRDNGSGMSKETLDHAFEPFYTTKGVGEGTGLGLSLVYSVLERHGANIEISSKLGEGSVLTLYFPRIEKLPEPALMSGFNSVASNERILVVDDDQMLLQMLKKTLEVVGYQVVAKADGMEALAAYKTDTAGFDLIISDVQMPKMTGKTLAKEILAINSNQDILLCTGHTQLISRQEAIGMGVRDLIMKPIPRQVLVDSIRDILDKRLCTIKGPA